MIRPNRNSVLLNILIILIAQLANTNALKIKHVLLHGVILMMVTVVFILIQMGDCILLTTGLIGKKETTPHSIYATP
jgi:hypothetical protein